MHIGHSKILDRDVNTHCPYGWMTTDLVPHDIQYAPGRNEYELHVHVEVPTW